MTVSNLPTILFAMVTMLVFRSGVAQNPAANDPRTTNEFVIGQTIALSGSQAEHGNAVVLGARSYFDFINARGGIRGRRVVVKTIDDGGDATRAARNTTRLIREENVIAMFGGIEGGPCVASMKVATEMRIPLVACMAGSPELRDPFNRYVFPVRAAHRSEFEHIVAITSDFRWDRVGFLYADNDTGRKHLANVEAILAQRNLKLTVAIPIPNPPNLAKIADAIIVAKLNAVFNHGGYDLYGEVIKQVRAKNIDGVPTNFLAVNSGAEQLSRALGPEARGLIFTQVVPYPWRSAPDVAREHRDALKIIAPNQKPSFSTLEGFISAKVLVEGLRRINAARVAGEDVVRALEQLGTLDVGGYQVHFTPESREGSRFVDTMMATGTGRFAH